MQAVSFIANKPILDRYGLDFVKPFKYNLEPKVSSLYERYGIEEPAIQSHALGNDQKSGFTAFAEEVIKKAKDFYSKIPLEIRQTTDLVKKVTDKAIDFVGNVNKVVQPIVDTMTYTGRALDNVVNDSPFIKFLPKTKVIAFLGLPFQTYDLVQHIKKLGERIIKNDVGKAFLKYF